MTLEEYAKKHMEKPYETIWGVKDNRDGKTVTVYSTYDTTHPDCPIKLIDYTFSPSEK